MTNRVFITGYGIITAAGNNAYENFQSLLKEKSNISKLEILKTIHYEIPAFEIKLTGQQLCRLAGIQEGKGFTRTATLALITAKEAIEMAGLTHIEIGKCGFISATTTGGIRELEKYYYELQDTDLPGDFSFFADTANPGQHAEHAAEEIGIKNYIATISTACSSSANSIALGAQLIKNNKLETVICGGAEALSKFTLNGFNSLMILSKEPCKPFDNIRNGLNLGEGEAYLVLESEAVINRTGRTPLAELVGSGNANDAFHQTASSPDGAGAFNAMSLALDNAGLQPPAIDYINAHGTATENNDLSEGLAIQTLFQNGVPYFSSTKPYTGHTLAAAGSVEAVFCLQALQHKIIYPNLNFREQMEELTISPQTQLIKNANLKYILSNSFGFGGNTSSLLFASV